MYSYGNESIIIVESLRCQNWKHVSSLSHSSGVEIVQIWTADFLAWPTQTTGIGIKVETGCFLSNIFTIICETRVSDLFIPMPVHKLAWHSSLLLSFESYRSWISEVSLDRPRPGNGGVCCVRLCRVTRLQRTRVCIFSHTHMFFTFSHFID